MVMTTMKRGRSLVWVPALFTYKRFGSKVFCQMRTREGALFSPINFK